MIPGALVQRHFGVPHDEPLWEYRVVCCAPCGLALRAPQVADHNAGRHHRKQRAFVADFLAGYTICRRTSWSLVWTLFLGWFIPALPRELRWAWRALTLGSTTTLVCVLDGWRPSRDIVEADRLAQMAWERGRVRRERVRAILPPGFGDLYAEYRSFHRLLQAARPQGALRVALQWLARAAPPRRRELMAEVLERHARRDGGADL